MAFNLRCAIATCASDDEAQRLAAAATAQLPWAMVRRFQRPFPGVIAGVHHIALWDEYVRDPGRFGFANKEAAAEALKRGVERRLPALSRCFPGKPFAYIDVDCFGGGCVYDGHIVIDGEVRHALPGPTYDGFLDLLRHLGVEDQEWYFEPFSREFWRAGDAPGTRRAVRGIVRGWLRGLSLSQLHAGLDSDLRPPWQLTIMGEDTVLVTRGGDDLVVSLNLVGDTVELAGRSHLPVADTIALIDEVLRRPTDLDATYEAELTSFEGGRLHRWRNVGQESGDYD